MKERKRYRRGKKQGVGELGWGSWGSGDQLLCLIASLIQNILCLWAKISGNAPSEYTECSRWSERDLD